LGLSVGLDGDVSAIMGDFLSFLGPALRWQEDKCCLLVFCS